MAEGTIIRTRGARARIRDWEVWSLPVVPRVYVVFLAVAWAACLAVALARDVPSVPELLVFLLLTGCGLASVEATRRQGEPAGVIAKDLLVPWLLSVAVVLPTGLAVLAPAALIATTHFRVKRAPVYRRVFTVATMGLSSGLVSVGLHELPRWWHLSDLAPGATALAWAGLLLGAALVWHLVNQALIGVAVATTDPEANWRDIMVGEQPLSDVGEMFISTMVALLCLLSPGLALVSLLPVILLQRALLHDQLSAAARLDAKTGLLNGPTWEREATSEIARATRTGSALSVMLLDLDHFKEVNDRFGHLAGDDILRGVAEAMKNQTREYDLIARFGGDEFAILLPQSDLMEAIRTAERIRRRVAAIAVPAGDHVVHTSVSIGVAELGAAGEGVTDLLARADLSLYRAKENRDAVHSALHEDLSFPRDL